ncbi:hypothetical protein LX15_001650 [Streptoalloteichus tenebrarius]|uniref:Uncharacterized protein n=1 Tax=Streptoalloteichus tenebrarius (strain ATCC 17920 / DSM 40477 / JCM 4838 / CBS 697.72 / NBRC 16177 / NCIMB 11028 / NRRL B-12390 / A12253. 1 / ISP 5477) TaxID=1933 RepID=A0ABT1HR49_STRSD|nr:hypothetical protein [Streptoalloteichus tenebrarius]MCP2257963.1 hypothetical protein [Streptoalloteichus tenebrarius]BFF01626.1 hypothetical protein GCM10020241_33010 [Streptoalloteichus tenebrarius]
MNADEDLAVLGRLLGELDAARDELRAVTAPLVDEVDGPEWEAVDRVRRGLGELAAWVEDLRSRVMREIESRDQ